LSSTTNTQGSDGSGGGSSSATGGAVANSGDADYPGSLAGYGGASDNGKQGAITVTVDGVTTTFSAAGEFSYFVPA
jgi:hypothetical protein